MSGHDKEPQHRKFAESIIRRKRNRKNNKHYEPNTLKLRILSLSVYRIKPVSVLLKS
jgi:hypothetical protein